MGRELALDLIELDLLLTAEDQQTLHEILEFANVAGPRVVAQAILRGDAEAPEWQMLLIDEPIDVVTQEIRYVLRVVAQRRDVQRDHVEARQQLLPHAAVRIQEARRR